MVTFSTKLRDPILLEVLLMESNWVRLSTHLKRNNSWINWPQLETWKQPSRCLKDLARGLSHQVRCLRIRLKTKKVKALNLNIGRRLVPATNSPIKIWTSKPMVWANKIKSARFLRVDKVICKESVEIWNRQISSRWVVSQNSERIGSITLFRMRRCRILSWPVKLLGMSSCCSVFIMLASIMNLSFTSIPSSMVEDPQMKCQIKFQSQIYLLVNKLQFSRLVSLDVAKQELSCWPNSWRLRTSSTISSWSSQQDSPIFWDHSNKSLVLNASLITKRLPLRVI